MPLTSGTIADVHEIQEDEANVNLVNSATINPVGEFFVSTPVGENDQRIPHTELTTLIAGIGFQSIANLLRHDVPSLVAAGAADDADLIIVDQGTGAVHMTRGDLVAGLVSLTNLTHTVNGNVSIDIESSDGTDTTILVATNVLTGFLSSTDRLAFASKLDAVDLTGTGTATGVTVANTAGDDAVLPVATASAAGVLNAADWTRFDTATGQTTDLNIGNQQDTTLDVTSSTGNPATIPAAQDVPGGAGLMTRGDKGKLDGIAPGATGVTIHTGDITSDGAGLVGINPNTIGKAELLAGTVDDTHMDTGAITAANGALAANAVINASIAAGAVNTLEVQDEAITVAKMQQVEGYSVLGRPSAAPGVMEDLTLGDMSDRTPDAGSRLLGWDSTGRIGQIDPALIVVGQSRKDGQDHLGNVTGAVPIDFDAGNFDNKVIVLTGDVTLTFTGTRPGDYQLWIEQDGTGNHSLTITNTTSPASDPPIVPTGGGATFVKFIFDHLGIWNW